MKPILFALLSLLSAASARADGPLLLGDQDALPELYIRVTRYENFLATPGSALRCMLSDGRFGYLITRGEGDKYSIDMISNGKLEGEKTRMQAELKDFGSPFIVYLSVHKRDGDYGSYFELLLNKKLNIFVGNLGGDVMYTEAFYTQEAGKEKETFKPVFKKPLRCEIE